MYRYKRFGLTVAGLALEFANRFTGARVVTCKIMQMSLFQSLVSAHAQDDANAFDTVPTALIGSVPELSDSSSVRVYDGLCTKRTKTKAWAPAGEGSGENHVPWCEKGTVGHITTS